MGLSMLQRKPDSGLGNIRSSPADPSRNIDWVLMLAQARAGGGRLLRGVLGHPHPHADPYTYVTRQVIFAIVAAVAMVIVMAIDYEWLKQHARALYVLTAMRPLPASPPSASRPGSTLLAVDVGPIQVQPAEFAKFTVLLALCRTSARSAPRRSATPASSAGCSSSACRRC